MFGLGVTIGIFIWFCMGRRVERWIGLFVATDETWMGDGDAVGLGVDLQVKYQNLNLQFVQDCPTHIG